MEKLKELRFKKKLTQAQVAQEIGIEQTSYGKYELGKAIPSVEVLQKLAEFFRVSTDYLLGRDENVEMVKIDISRLPEKYQKKFENEEVEILEIAKEAVEQGITAADLRNILKLIRDFKKADK